MSGLIGGAGSKSGIIGETELDYDEGLWTPAPGDEGVTFGGYGFNYYRKIGGICFMQASISNVSASFGTTTGLPFATNPSGASYEGAGGNVMFNGITANADCASISPYIYNNAIYFYQSVSGGGWVHSSGSFWTANDDFIFSVYFPCAIS